MTVTRDLEQRLAEFYESERPYRAPDRLLQSVIRAVEETDQRRVPHLPWAFPNIGTSARLAAAALAVLAVVVLGAYFLGSANEGVATYPTASPTPSAPALTESYTSAVHGMSVAHPTDWEVRPAVVPWLEGELTLESTFADVISHPSGYPSIALASTPLGEQDGPEWVQSFLASRPCGTASFTAVDTLSGRFTACVGGAHVVAADDSRGLVVWLYESDPPTSDDLDWFKGLVDTVGVYRRPSVQISRGFRVPFTFDLPASPRFDFAAHSSGRHEIRVPKFAEAGRPSGVITEAIGGGRVDPCDEASGALTVADGPQAVIDYLRTVPGVEVTDDVETTIGGLAAVQATVTGSEDGSGCQGETFAWVENSEPFSAVPLEAPRRVIAVDVAGDHLVFTVYGEESNPAWTPMADELLASIEFPVD
jgi:hypothetical protein